jgi:hypothetical protein
MVVVPVAIPFTIPVDEPMVAMAMALLLHVPPVVLSVNVSDEPAHKPVVAVIGAAGASTVTVITAAQPVPKE